MKIFKSVLVLSALLTMLVACGDDSSSSSVSPDPRPCEDQNEDCDDTSSSSGEVSKNSSSSQKNSNKEKSSSSVEKSKFSSSSVIPASSGDLQSSSSKDSKNSSSSEEKAKESSSSVKPSSSDAKSSSSEEVKQSSSSVVASSSSVAEQSSSSRNWQPFNLANYGDKYEEFTDDRNGRTYKYLKFEGKDTSGKAATIHAMVENLNVGDFVWGHKDQKDDSKIERYCYDDDTLNCHYYGGLYQWAEMMQLPFECNTKSCADLIKPNHQGICPSGWRLLTYNDYYIVVNSNGNKDGVEGTRSTFGFGGSNDTGYSLVETGYNWNYSFGKLNETTYWHYPEEFSEETSLVSYQSRSEEYNPIAHKPKIFGFSVRCVMVE